MDVVNAHVVHSCKKLACSCYTKKNLHHHHHRHSMYKNEPTTTTSKSRNALKEVKAFEHSILHDFEIIDLHFCSHAHRKVITLCLFSEV